MQRTFFCSTLDIIKFATSKLKNIFVMSIIFFVSKEDKAKLFKLIQKKKLILYTLLILNQVKLNMLNFNIHKR